MDPPTPVLPNGPLGSYDGNGNWLLHVAQVGDDAQELVGFTHVENHVFNCTGGYGEWNGAAVVRSSDQGRSWTRQGLAVADPQPCNASFGGSGYASVLPAAGGGPGFVGYGGCTAFRSTDAAGAAGSWERWYNGGFTEPGIDGRQSCLPGVPGDACCPIVHYNAFLRVHVMLYTVWGVNSTLFVATATDDAGLAWGPSSVLLEVPPPRAIAYGQIVGSTAGATQTLAYAAAPPTGAYPRDFVARNITWAA